jgi:hypothetical protein
VGSFKVGFGTSNAEDGKYENGRRGRERIEMGGEAEKMDFGVSGRR